MLFLLFLEHQKKALALGHGEELVKKLLFQKHLLEISNLNSPQLGLLAANKQNTAQHNLAFPCLVGKGWS